MTGMESATRIDTWPLYWNNLHVFKYFPVLAHRTNGVGDFFTWLFAADSALAPADEFDQVTGFGSGQFRFDFQ